MVSEVKQISGNAVPLIGNDIDTDRIIPARYLKAITFDDLGAGVFVDDRKALNGEHPFDQIHYQGAKILIANRNFGCGSSREHAPQALAKWGIKALIGESFAEIFFGNCVAMGIPCVTAECEVVKQLQELVIANPFVLLPSLLSVSVILSLTFSISFSNFSSVIKKSLFITSDIFKFS